MQQFETITDAIKQTRFEHTGLKPQMTLEYLPATRLGHAVRRTAERLIYEAYRGHKAYLYTDEWVRARQILTELTAYGTVVRLLLGPSEIVDENPILPAPNRMGFFGAFGHCLDCDEWFGQVAEGTILGLHIEETVRLRAVFA